MTRSVQRLKQKAFALPTVLIGSVVMIIVMLSAITATVSVSSAINAQYYNKLSLEAGESGTAMAVSCIKQNGAVAWTSPLAPGTDCNGVGTPGYVLTTTNVRTSFSVASPSIATDGTVQLAITSSTELLRTSNGIPWKTYATTTSSTVTQKNDITATRAAQHYWAFGNKARIDFGMNGTAATAQLSPGTGDSVEGVTTVSDLNGNLLFWSNGLDVWDSSGAVMSNSAGLTGTYTTTQAVAAFPLDTAAKTYVIITNSAASGTGPGELYYSVIDMNLNGTLGAVVAGKKNIKLGTTSGYSSESLVAAPNAAGNGFWVLTYTPNTTSTAATGKMVAFQFTYDGSTLTISGPVNSTIPSVPPTCSTTGIGFGTLNFNADYTKLVLQAGGGVCNSTGNLHVGNVKLYDFNAATGVVTEQFSWVPGTSQALADGANGGYSADFSPAENYIYTTQIYPGRLYRYKITGATSSADVKASEEYIGPTSNGTATVYNGGGQVKRAPNGKMYVADRFKAALHVINNPDALLGSIGWQYGGFPLASGAVSGYGLPQMVTYNKRVIVTY